IFRQFPHWKILAANAAYDGRNVPLVLGVIFLATMHVVQATLFERLCWISVFGLAVVLAAFPAAFFERRLFRGEPAFRKARRWPDRIGILFLVLNLLVAGRFAAGKAPEAPEGSPPVFFISVDTVRADHLSVYGYARQTCPNLEALAADGVVVEQHISQAPWTLPAHATMFCGLPPGEHGVTTQARAFSPSTPLFPEVLKERGYRNGAIVSSLLLSPTFGYAPGFDKYEMNIEFSGEEVVQKGLRWLFASKKTP
ncbi:unnamed protein product, partial [marine sediment metagenome]